MPHSPIWAIDSIVLWRKGAGVNGSLPYLNRASGYRGELTARVPIFEIGLKQARLTCARKLLAKLEPNMAEMNDGEILTHIATVPPKLAARTLLRLAGKNKKADELLGFVYMHAVKGDDESAAKIAECLCEAVQNLLVKNDAEVAEVMGIDFGKGLSNVLNAAKGAASNPIGASVLSMIPGVGAFLPEIIKSGASLMDAAKKGNPAAVKKVQNVIAVAKTGDPKAEKALEALKVANALVKKDIPVPAPAAPLAKPPQVLTPLTPSVVLKPANPAKATVQRSKSGLYIPSWTDENGMAIRAAPTGVLRDMRQKAIDFRAYGTTSAQTMRGLQPMIEEELRARGEMPRDNPIKASEGQKWWQGNIRAIDHAI